MPSNYTDKYQLSQWEKSDKVQMEDFNSDNQKIEDALAAKAEQSQVDELSNTVAAALPEMPRVAVGTYQGTGKYGADGPASITFPFEPKLVVLMGGGSCAVFLAGNKSAQMLSGEYIARYAVTWDGATMSWYNTSALWKYANTSINASHQMNAANATYNYLVIG